MSVRDKLRWKAWADSLRQEMMMNLTPHVTKSVREIMEETETEKPESVMVTRRFWTTCQAATGANDTLSKAGLDIEFEPDGAGKVDRVTLLLNDTWKGIMQRVLDRRVDSSGPAAANNNDA
jgi:hypothetical protein